MKTLEAEIRYENEQIAEAIAEIETSLRNDLAREIGVGEEVFTAEELLEMGVWKDDFNQWEEFHASEYPCDNDRNFSVEEQVSRRKNAFDNWLENTIEFYCK